MRRLFHVCWFSSGTAQSAHCFRYGAGAPTHRRIEGGHRSGHLQSRGQGARRCGVDRAALFGVERGICILCDFLVINGVLAKDNGHYKHTPSSAAFLDPASPSCMASVAHFLSEEAIMQADVNLAEIVRNGRTHLPGSGTVEPENPLWVEFAEKMAPMMGPMAAPLGALVLKGHNGPMRVLDIAAGHGLFGIEIAKQNRAISHRHRPIDIQPYL